MTERQDLFATPILKASPPDAETLNAALLKSIAPGGKRQFTWSIEMWANVNPPGCSNQLHCHPAAFWSGVYYPDPNKS